MMKEHTFTIKRTITDQQIDYIMSAALQGITYWADDANVLWKDFPEGETVQYISEALTHGGNLRIHDAEEEKWHKLTLKKFLKGLTFVPEFDFEDYDMYDAERVVQCALFGKLIYG